MSDERGAATVLAAVLICALIAITVGGLWVGSAMLARHRAQAAADLAALAAAARLPAGAEIACRRAQGVVEAMRATMRWCDVEKLDITVTVTVDTGLRLGRPATAAARAGPTE